MSIIEIKNFREMRFFGAVYIKHLDTNSTGMPHGIRAADFDFEPCSSASLITDHHSLWKPTRKAKSTNRCQNQG